MQSLSHTVSMTTAKSCVSQMLFWLVKTNTWDAWQFFLNGLGSFTWAFWVSYILSFQIFL